MKYLIVGAGISGLYAAYSLHKKFGIKDILIIEKSNRLGGRIYSFDIGSRIVELGAGVILIIHNNLLELVNELGLQDKLIYNESKRSYMSLSFDQNFYQINKITNLNDSGFVEKVNDLRNMISNNNNNNNNNKLNNKLIGSYSLYRFIERVYGIDIANKMNNEFGYDGDFNQNAIDCINMLTRDVNTPFYILKDGLIQIINKLKDYLEKNGIEIRLNTECINIKKDNNIGYQCILNNGILVADNIILSIPKNSLLSLKYLSPIKDLLNSVLTKSLMRIYLVFPTINGKSWFDNLNGVITTNTILRQISPIDKKNGILMVYSAELTANTWNYLKKNKKLKSEIMFHLRRTFHNILIPDLIKIYSKYWNEATHIWKPSYSSEKISEEIIQPFKDEKIFIVGESYSNIQQWSQGTLETVNKLMNIISLFH